MRKVIRIAQRVEHRGRKAEVGRADITLTVQPQDVVVIGGAGADVQQRLAVHYRDVIQVDGLGLPSRVGAGSVGIRPSSPCVVAPVTDVPDERAVLGVELMVNADRLGVVVENPRILGSEVPLSERTLEGRVVGQRKVVDVLERDRVEPALRNDVVRKRIAHHPSARVEPRRRRIVDPDPG